MKTPVKRWLRLEARAKEIRKTSGSEGSVAVEYVLIIMTIALVLVAGAGRLGEAVAAMYMRLVERLF